MIRGFYINLGFRNGGLFSFLPPLFCKIKYSSFENTKVYITSFYSRMQGNETNLTLSMGSMDI